MNLTQHNTFADFALNESLKDIMFLKPVIAKNKWLTKDIFKSYKNYIDFNIITSSDIKEVNGVDAVKNYKGEKNGREFLKLWFSNDDPNTILFVSWTNNKPMYKNSFGNKKVLDYWKLVGDLENPNDVRLQKTLKEFDKVIVITTHGGKGTKTLKEFMKKIKKAKADGIEVKEGSDDSPLNVCDPTTKPALYIKTSYESLKGCGSNHNNIVKNKLANDNKPTDWVKMWNTLDKYLVFSKGISDGLWYTSSADKSIEKFKLWFSWKDGFYSDEGSASPNLPLILKIIKDNNIMVSNLFYSKGFISMDAAQGKSEKASMMLTTDISTAYFNGHINNATDRAFDTAPDEMKSIYRSIKGREMLLVQDKQYFENPLVQDFLSDVLMYYVQAEGLKGDRLPFNSKGSDIKLTTKRLK